MTHPRLRLRSTQLSSLQLAYVHALASLTRVRVPRCKGPGFSHLTQCQQTGTEEALDKHLLNESMVEWICSTTTGSWNQTIPPPTGSPQHWECPRMDTGVRHAQKARVNVPMFTAVSRGREGIDCLPSCLLFTLMLISFFFFFFILNFILFLNLT